MSSTFSLILANPNSSKQFGIIYYPCSPVAEKYIPVTCVAMKRGEQFSLLSRDIGNKGFVRCTARTGAGKGLAKVNNENERECERQ